ncbi:sugar-binding protein [Halalkalibacter hemicellulosilyticus]|uniref:Sugar ABC transporter n=1 Tax=Halalkalibacter hemicellulosilyticusJCM 9152 TaxID=1236971 RepID=W4QDJ8_9BACI|nr:sugar-binding protein [Halalkalibacter hemicellulosilyticus]GAE29414.1 sugar ABC transporter [Halalkalibacter hemicellulosilyticusJCM 9152]
MNRKPIHYYVLLSLLIVAIGFSFYYYQQVQTYEHRIDDEIAPDSSLPTYHFVLIGEEMNHDYWRLVGEGAKQTEERYDVFVEYKGPSRSNPEEQLKLLDMAIKSKVDGMIVQALNESFTPLINQAVNEGIPVMTIDTDSPESLRAAYIGTDNYVAGQLAGEALIEDTNGQATVGIITGSFDNTHHQLRVQGFKDTIEKVDGIDIVAVEESNITRVEAEEKAYTMLSEHDEITAMIGTSSWDGIGIVAAAQTLQKQESLYVMTFDPLEENIQLLETGELDAIVEQQPLEMGYRSIEMMLDLIQGDVVDEIYHTNASIIRRSNIDSWKREKGESL